MVCVKHIPTFNSSTRRMPSRGRERERERVNAKIGETKTKKISKSMWGGKFDAYDKNKPKNMISPIKVMGCLFIFLIFIQICGVIKKIRATEKTFNDCCLS